LGLIIVLALSNQLNQLMKKLTFLYSILLISAFALLPKYTHAQGGERVWSIGLEAGPNFSKYGWDGSNTDFKTGFILGGNLTYSIQNTYGITGKLLYAQKGAKDGNAKATLNYIEIPVVGRWFFNREGVFRPSVFVGPSFGFLTGVKSKVGNADAIKVDNYTNIYKTFDFGLTGGIGLNYEIAPETRILLDLRYTYGLSDITKSGTSSVNNQVIGITAGFSIGI